MSVITPPSYTDREIEGWFSGLGDLLSDADLLTLIKEARQELAIEAHSTSAGAPSCYNPSLLDQAEALFFHVASELAPLRSKLARAVEDFRASRPSDNPVHASELLGALDAYLQFYPTRKPGNDRADWRPIDARWRSLLERMVRRNQRRRASAKAPRGLKTALNEAISTVLERIYGIDLEPATIATGLRRAEGSRKRTQNR